MGEGFRLETNQDRVVRSSNRINELREVTRLHVRLALFSPNAEYLPEPVGLSWLPGEVRRFAWFTVTLESKVSVDAAFRSALVGRHSLRPWCRALESGNLL